MAVLKYFSSLLISINNLSDKPERHDEHRLVGHGRSAAGKDDEEGESRGGNEHRDEDDAEDESGATS
jgi:hypothetical protein